MAKKQVIRLTENDLHKIIKESVNNILSELDWKTCTSAALERSKCSGHKSDLAQKDIKRAAKKAKESQSKDKEKFDQDFSDYFDGKTKYVKGKGWIKESVKRVLNENTDENYEIKRLLTNLYGWTQFYEEEFDKANIRDRSDSIYSMWGALREMQNIIGRLYNLCLKSNPSDRAL